MITALAVIGHYEPQLVTDLFRSKQKNVEIESTSDNEAAAAPDVETINLFGDAILAIESDSLFTSRGTKALRTIVDELESTDYILSLIHI